MANIFSKLFSNSTMAKETSQGDAFKKKATNKNPVRPDNFEVPNLGLVKLHPEYGWYESGEVVVPVLGGRICRFLLSGYDGDANQADFHDAIANFLSTGKEILEASGKYVLAYYQDTCEWTDAVDPPFIKEAQNIWNEVTLPTDIHVSRRFYGDKKIYISLECECSWEEEHGLQIVFKEGLVVNKVGPYSGHDTNADAYANPEFENRIYIGTDELFKMN